jgi:hypothetical protein
MSPVPIFPNLYVPKSLQSPRNTPKTRKRKKIVHRNYFEVFFGEKRGKGGGWGVWGDKEVPNSPHKIFKKGTGHRNLSARKPVRFFARVEAVPFARHYLRPVYKDTPAYDSTTLHPTSCPTPKQAFCLSPNLLRYG